MESPIVGDSVKFGGISWDILEVQEDKALLITSKSVGKRGYDIDDGYHVTRWSNCTLQKWLNEKFLKRFSKIERRMIIPTVVEEPLQRQAPWNPEVIVTSGPEYDSFFVLSYTEMIKYNPSFMGKDEKVWLRTGNINPFTGDMGDGMNLVVEYYSKNAESSRAFTEAFNARMKVYPAFWLSVG